MTERETRAILRKAGKRIGQLIAQNTVSESKNAIKQAIKIDVTVVNSQ